MSPASYRTAPPRVVASPTLRDRSGRTKSVVLEVRRTPFGLGLGRVLEVLLQVLLRLVVGGEVALLEGVLALLVGLLHALDGRGELLRVARAVATGPVTAVT